MFCKKQIITCILLGLVVTSAFGFSNPVELLGVPDKVEFSNELSDTPKKVQLLGKIRKFSSDAESTIQSATTGKDSYVNDFHNLDAGIGLGYRSNKAVLGIVDIGLSANLWSKLQNEFGIDIKWIDFRNVCVKYVHFTGFGTYCVKYEKQTIITENPEDGYSDSSDPGHGDGVLASAAQTLAPGSTIFYVQLRKYGSTACDGGNWDNAVAYFYNNGNPRISVMTMSTGPCIESFDYTPGLKRLHDSGVLLFQAGGNENSVTDEAGESPYAYSVGGITRNRIHTGRYNAFADEIQFVTVASQIDVYSNDVTGGTPTIVTETIAGTSFSSPIVAAIATNAYDVCISTHYDKTSSIKCRDRVLVALQDSGEGTETGWDNFCYCYVSIPVNPSIGNDASDEYERLFGWGLPDQYDAIKLLIDHQGNPHYFKKVGTSRMRIWFNTPTTTEGTVVSLGTQTIELRVTLTRTKFDYTRILSLHYNSEELDSFYATSGTRTHVFSFSASKLQNGYLDLQLRFAGYKDHAWRINLDTVHFTGDTNGRHVAFITGGTT